MISLKNLSLASLASISLLLSGWSFFVYNKKVINPRDHSKPDAFMEDVVATVIDKQGNPSLQIVASKMVHYIENDSTEISNPWLTLYRKSPKPWQLTAEHAKTFQGVNQIYLWENVVINHPGDEQNQKTTLLTPTLKVFPERQVAMTDDPVIITQPNTTIHAIGMSADLVSGAVKLLSQAQGEFSVKE